MNIQRRVWEQRQRRGRTYPPRSALLSADTGSDGDVFLTQSDASAHKHRKARWGGRPAWLPRFCFMSDSEIDPSIRAARSLIGLSASLYYAQTCLPAGYTGQHSWGKVHSNSSRSPYYWSNKLAVTAVAPCSQAHVHMFHFTSAQASFYLWPLPLYSCVSLVIARRPRSCSRSPDNCRQACFVQAHL